MSITAANAVIMLSVRGLFPVPQAMKQFSADDVYGVDPQETAQVQMGVDGNLAGGFVYVETKWNITLQADSPSQDFFDNWKAAQIAARETFIADGLVVLTAIGKSWTMTKGYLTAYAPMPDGKKVLQPRRFGITWEKVEPARV